MILVLLASCKKESNMYSEDNNGIANEYATTTKDKVLKLAEWSLKIRNKDASVSRSGSSEFTYSSAANNVEELLNFTYCRPDTFFQEYLVHYDTLKVAVNSNNKIDESDLDDLFIAMVNSSAYVFDQDTNGVKKPIQFGVKSLNTDGSTIDSAQMQLFFMFGTKYGVPGPLEDPLYEEDDHWWYGGSAGKCGPYSGGQPLDAAKIFTRDLRRALIPRSAPYEFYYSAPIITCFHVGNYCSAYDIPSLIYNTYYQQGEDFQNPWLYWGTTPNVCLDQELMNWHYPIYRDRFIKDYLPSGKAPSSLWVGYDLINTSRVHALAVIYSTKNYFEATSPYPILLEPIP